MSTDIPLSFFGEPENVDHWPSLEASEQYVDNLVAIVERGYLGVQVRSAERSGGGILFSLALDVATPEGRLVQFLSRIASKGLQPSTSEIMSILERVYREQGLPLPAQPDKLH